jgi:hypothetical protein
MFSFSWRLSFPGDPRFELLVEAGKKRSALLE